MGLFILLCLFKLDIEVRGSLACDFIVKGHIIGIMPAIVLLFLTDTPFRVDNAVLIEQFLGVQPNPVGLFCRGTQNVSRLIATLLKDPLSRPLWFFRIDRLLLRTYLIELNPNLVLEFVELGNGCLKFRFHSIK